MRIKTEAKRTEILAAAAAEFFQRGFHETTLAHVAAHMGSSKSTIYNYFPTKEELFIAMLVEQARPVKAALLRHLDGPAPAAERLAAFARAFVHMNASKTTVAVQRLLVADLAMAAAAIHQLREVDADGLWQSVERWLGAEQASGAIRAGQPCEMMRHLSALLHGDLPLRLMFGESVSFTDAEKDASADSAVRMFLAAYGA